VDASLSKRRIHKLVLNSNQNSEMGSACGTCSSERSYVQGPWYDYLKESAYLFICTFYKMSLKKVSCVYVNWFQPARDRDKRWALMKCVMNFGVP